MAKQWPGAMFGRGWVGRWEGESGRVRAARQQITCQQIYGKFMLTTCPAQAANSRRQAARILSACLTANAKIVAYLFALRFVQPFFKRQWVAERRHHVGLVESAYRSIFRQLRAYANCLNAGGQTGRRRQGAEELVIAWQSWAK